MNIDIFVVDGVVDSNNVDIIERFRRSWKKQKLYNFLRFRLMADLLLSLSFLLSLPQLKLLLSSFFIIVIVYSSASSSLWYFGFLLLALLFLLVEPFPRTQEKAKQYTHGGSFSCSLREKRKESFA